jgi:signal transduction histidine kinase
MTEVRGAHGDGALGDRRLLLVEDDAEIRISLAELLREDGYEVVTTTNGAEALDYLRGSPAPALILLDLTMPVKDGWQFRIEQRRDPSIASIPVLAMSADDTAKAAAIDADLYIKKPFKYEALVQSVRRIIEGRRLAHLDRMASLGTLAAGIAHEINNPLTYVMGNLQLLEKEIPRAFQELLAAGQKGGPAAQDRLSELHTRVRDALEGADRIRGIVRHVKTFSRAGDEHRALVDVQSVLESSIKVVSGEIRQRARLVQDYHPVPQVFANPGQLGQVFLNLLLNAAQAVGDQDPQKNTVRVSTGTSPAGQAIIEFADTGSGIAPGIRDRIFDPFFTTKPFGAGTGLGLSICHGIVRSLEGTITVESEMGKGSTFRVTLPSSQDHSPPPPRSMPFPLAARARILVIDDEPRVTEAVRGLLEPDYDVTVRTSGTAAIALLAQEPQGAGFDVILCDMHMPEMTGMDLYEELVRLRPAMAERTIFMTGGTFTRKSREFVTRVKNPCIDKPIDMAALRSLLAKSLAGKLTRG